MVEENELGSDSDNAAENEVGTVGKERKEGKDVEKGRREKIRMEL